MRIVKAKQSFSHPTPMYHCSMYELVLPEELEFNCITVKFNSVGRDNVKFEVEDEHAGEIFEECYRYATQSMPQQVVDAVQKILAFYEIELDNESKMYLRELAKKCISNAEGVYGKTAEDDEIYHANALLMVSNKMKFHPIQGMLDTKSILAR